MSAEHNSGYKETYLRLCHGTADESAEAILEQQSFIPSRRGWCGKGVYFYDIKSKAYWSANRTCEERRRVSGKRCKPVVVYADIIDIPRDDILDLRDYGNLKDFAGFVNGFLENNPFSAENVSGDELIELLREAMISFYAKEKNKRLVIGYFSQRYQPKYEDMREFSNSMHLVYGI
nr:hypothetical protein [Clostridia bacterium]